MEELSIVLGLIILITVVIMYSRSQATKPCESRVQYFDEMYYQMPKLHTVPMQSTGLNDKITVARELPLQQHETNQQASRWSGSVESQPENDSCNTRQTTNTDIAVEPLTLQHALNANKYLRKQASISLNRASHVEGFADDEWLDSTFRYSAKYNFDGSDVNDELLTIADAELSKPKQNIPITVVRNAPTASAIRKVINEPIRRQICARKKRRAAGTLNTWY